MPLFSEQEGGNERTLQTKRLLRVPGQAWLTAVQTRSMVPDPLLLEATFQPFNQRIKSLKAADSFSTSYAKSTNKASKKRIIQNLAADYELRVHGIRTRACRLMLLSSLITAEQVCGPRQSCNRAAPDGQRRRGLKSRRHLTCVHRITASVRIPGDKQDCGIERPVQHMVVG